MNNDTMKSNVWTQTKYEILNSELINHIMKAILMKHTPKIKIWDNLILNLINPYTTLQINKDLI